MLQRVTFILILLGWFVPCKAQFFPRVQQKTVVAGVSVFQELEFDNSYLLTLDFAREYKLRTWFALGAEGNVFKFTSGNYSTAGLSIRPVTRLFFYSGKKLDLFGETKGGIIFMLPQHPDKMINFTFTANVGADWYFKEDMAIRFSGGYMHFSNGKPRAELRNPTWDGLGTSVALVRTIP